MVFLIQVKASRAETEQPRFPVGSIFLSVHGMMAPYHPVVWPRGRMDMPDRLSADYWRERAKVARTQASDVGNEKARRALLGTAENYEQLAEQAETLRKTGAAPIYQNEPH